MFRLLNTLVWAALILLGINAFATGHWRYVRYKNGNIQRALFVEAPGFEPQYNNGTSQFEWRTYWRITPWRDYKCS